MKLYQLTGVNKSGEEWGKDWQPLLFSTMEKAQRQLATEKAAYTFNGVCDWQFTIKEVDYNEQTN